VVTIHDLAPWILPGHFKNWRKALRYKWQHFISAQRADMVITDSDASRNDIIRLCRISPKKIRTIYLGYESHVYDSASVAEILAHYGLTGGTYIIDPIGIDHPRRNPLLAVYGFYDWVKKTNADFKLVFTGNFNENSPEYVKFREEIRRLDLEKKIVVTGWIPDKTLGVLLKNAAVSIIPSLYEGFCLPLLESFCAGVPVIATNRGSIPEIAGGAAALVHPTLWLWRSTGF
jgi:alpha-1,3-rhamnosyl/mannosyltransferase